MADTERRRYLPSPWQANLLAFGVMFALVVGWFYLQTREAQRLFLADAGEHARLLADAVALHARGAVLAQETTDTLLTGFLGSSARFVDYLDGIEPFRDDELAAFAAETGLAMIRIQRGDGVSQGPPDWRTVRPLNCTVTGRLLRLADAHTVLFGLPRGDAQGCVLVGTDSRLFDAIRDTVGLPRAMRAVAELPGVLRVGLEGKVQPTAVGGGHGEPVVAMGHRPDGLPVAEVRVPLAGARLVLALDAGSLLRMRDRQWHAFLLFATVLALAGGLLSWLLYRYQRTHLEQLQTFERRLSRQREEAGLGRAAAAIAHEIRNPLNAMGMGLQRLQMEATGLDEEHRRLVTVMREALRRSNDSITGLLDYARPCRPQPEPLDPGALLRDVLALYRGRMAESGIRLTETIEERVALHADPGLLRRVLDNLLRNALEAQPDGGWLELRLEAGRSAVTLLLANGGFTLPAEEAPHILEPWFTTRPEGTGLGLAISRRIVAAHGGSLDLAVPRPGTLQLLITLPRTQPTEPTETQ